MGLCVAFCVLMTVLTYTASPLYVTLFTKDPEVMARSVRYIKMFTAMIIPLAVQYPLVDETTALGHVRLALFCSAFRKTIFLAGLLLLPRLISPEATFFSGAHCRSDGSAGDFRPVLPLLPRIVAARSEAVAKKNA